MVPWVCLQFVIVVFPDQTHILHPISWLLEMIVCTAQVVKTISCPIKCKGLTLRYTQGPINPFAGFFPLETVINNKIRGESQCTKRLNML